MRQSSSPTQTETYNSRLRFGVRRLGHSLVFASAVAAISVIITRLVVFPLGTMNADELAYQNMAAAFLNGHTKIPVDAVLGSNSTPWLMFNMGSWSIPKYQPLFSIFLIPAQWFGLWLPLAILAFACTYTVGKLAETFGSSAIRVAWIWNASAAFLIGASTALPYIFSLELGLLILLVAMKTERLLALKLGALVSLAILCRPLDAILFVIAAAAALYQRKLLFGVKRLATYALALALACLPALAWNYIQTGSPLHFPFTLTSKLDAWGFGVRKVYDSDPGTNFTVLNGLQATGNNLARVLTWTFGGVVMLPMVYLAIRREYVKYRLTLLVWSVSWIIAYGCFWGSYTTIRFWNGPDYLGPFYWLPLSVMIVILIASVPRGVLRWKLLWAASGIVAAFVLGAAVSRNWQMTDSWNSSELMRVKHEVGSVVKLDKAYSTHVGSPIQLISNPPGDRRFSTTWAGVMAIISDSKLQNPKIWFATSTDQTRFDYLPIISRVHGTSIAPSFNFRSKHAVQIQISTARSCRFVTLPANTALKLEPWGSNAVKQFTGKCSERVETNEITVKLMRVDTGKIARKIFTYRDTAHQKYYYAVY